MRWLFARPLIFGLLVYAVLLLPAFMMRVLARCRDGWASASIGQQGACSWHGGLARKKWRAKASSGGQLERDALELNWAFVAQR